MGEIINFPIALDSDLGRELIVDCCRFQEEILTEKQIRKKYRFSNADWDALGENDPLVEKIESERLRRTRDGSAKREKSQALITKAPGILDSIMSGGSDVSPRHKIDAIRTLDGMAANGPAGVPAADRFVISIVLSADGIPHTEHFNKSIAVDVNDVDPNDTSMPHLAAIAAKKTTENGGGNII